MKLTILGCNGALPAYGRFPTCQVLDIGSELFLIDCGEGAQINMQKFGIKSSKINNVFISHLHGDHFFGLIGWLNSQALFGRKNDLHIFANQKLQHIIAIQLDYALPYTIYYHQLEPNQDSVCINTDKLEVISFPVLHSVPTHGFRFTVKHNKRIMISEAVRQQQIPQYFYKKITMGLDYTKPNGDVVLNEDVTTTGKPNLVYSYCADTGFTDSYTSFIKDSNLVYHEATYCQDQLDKATERFHCTAIQAATIALQANAQQLVIGHYSSKYKTTEQHFAEATTIFENVILAEEGLEIEIV